MSLHFRSFEEMLELVGDKIVKTEQGPYIRVEDLKALNDELGKARQAQKAKEEEPKPKTFAGANEAAKRDPEYLALFEAKKSPTAPAVVRDTNVAKEESNAAA